MSLFKTIINRCAFTISTRLFSNVTSVKNSVQNTDNNKFEPVFSFPFITKFSLFNRLKIYQIVATALAVPGCGILEMSNYISSGSTLGAMYIGK